MFTRVNFFWYVDWDKNVFMQCCNAKTMPDIIALMQNNIQKNYYTKKFLKADQKLSNVSLQQTRPIVCMFISET